MLLLQRPALFICMCLVLLELKKKCLVGTSVSQISLWSRSALSAAFLSPVGFSFFFLNLFSPFPLFLLLLLPLPLLLPLFVYPFLAFCSFFPCLCYVGFHAVLSETSNQQQQQDWTEPELFLRKATQQCEIDGVCSQMRSASLHCVCVSEYVCLSFAGWRDECRLKWMRE